MFPFQNSFFKKKKEKAIYFKTQQNILTCDDRVIPNWLQKIISDHNGIILSIFILFSWGKKEKSISKIQVHQKILSLWKPFLICLYCNLAHSQIQFFWNTKRVSSTPHFWLSFSVHLLTLFLPHWPLLHLSICSWMSFFCWGCSIDLESSWIPESHPLSKSPLSFFFLAYLFHGFFTQWGCYI